MPEGDTLKKIQLRLNETILGQRVLDFSSQVPDLARIDFIDQAVTQVSARGKHLLIFFDHDFIIHTHLGREGRWRIRPRAEFAQSPRQVTAVISTQKWVAICENAPIAEVLTPWTLKSHSLLSKLGPDILEPSVNLEEIVRRLTAAGDVSLGENLLNQKVCAGIGNIYKSEMLFLEGLNPFTPTKELDSERLLSLIERTRKWMLRNISPGRRRTHWGYRTVKWVYKRAGEHCMKCDEVIQMRRQGPQQRSTYYCPQCQKVPLKPARKPSREK